MTSTRLTQKVLVCIEAPASSVMDSGAGRSQRHASGGDSLHSQQTSGQHYYQWPEQQPSFGQTFEPVQIRAIAEHVRTLNRSIQNQNSAEPWRARGCWRDRYGLACAHAGDTTSGARPAAVSRWRKSPGCRSELSPTCLRMNLIPVRPRPLMHSAVCVWLRWLNVSTQHYNLSEPVSSNKSTIWSTAPKRSAGSKHTWPG